MSTAREFNLVKISLEGRIIHDIILRFNTDISLEECQITRIGILKLTVALSATPIRDVSSVITSLIINQVIRY